MDVEERRARLAFRHRLADRASSVEEVADSVVALHATDPASLYLSIAARLTNPSIEAIDDALFERRSVMRTLAMRRTLFVATREHLPIIEQSSSIDVAKTERKRLEKFLAESGIDDPSNWLAEATVEVADALADGEGLPARTLTKLIPRLATKVTMGAGTKHAVVAGATSRVLGLLAVEGHLARGRPSGGWTGRQYAWHRRDLWCAVSDPPSPTDAASELLRRWLERFGPATLSDLTWWTGWTVTKTTSTLATLDIDEVQLDDGPGIVLANDLSTVIAPPPWVALLPALDPTSMGWKRRHWYVGDHAAELFDRNGNIGPTIWVDGRIVGGWGQDADARISLGLLERVGRKQRKMIDDEASRLEQFIGDTTFKPSFPTPLQKRLAVGDS